MTDSAPAAWFEYLWPWNLPFPVGCHLLDSFDGYVRILHPAFDREDRPIRWSAIAKHTGRTVHPQMNYEQITSDAADEALGVDAGPGCCIDPFTLDALVDVLHRHTRRADRCWYGQRVTKRDWEALGEPRRIALAYPQGGREYILLKAPLAAAKEWRRIGLCQPSYWWPDDINWTLYTDIDWNFTVIGGPASLIADLESDARLEAFRITAHTVFRDDVNT